MSAWTLQERLAALSPDARTLLARRLQIHELERRTAETGNDQLVAYYEKREGTAVPPNELRRLLLERLPRFMVPSRFVALDNLPLLPNGKVDRQALLVRRDDLVPTAPGRVCEPAADAVEEQMTRIFSDLIDVAEVGREDSFFELGGDSLLLPRLIDRIEGDFGVTFQSRSCFRSADRPPVSPRQCRTGSPPPRGGRSCRSGRTVVARRCTWSRARRGDQLFLQRRAVLASGTARICAAASGGRLHRAGTDSCPLYSRDSTAAADRSVSAWRLLPRWMDRVRNGASTRRGRRVRPTVDDH